MKMDVKSKPTMRRYSPEQKEQAVRMVFDVEPKNPANAAALRCSTMARTWPVSALTITVT